MTLSNPDKIGFLGLGAYTPERVMTNDEWTEWVDTSNEWIVQRTGIERRRVVAEGESTADLAVHAATRALANAGITAQEIDEIIVATDTPEVYIPDTASFVQHRLGAREIPAYDLGGSGCAGFLQALDVARSRVMTGKQHVLVIGVEVLTRLMNWRDRNTCVLFGDAAGAAIISRSDQAHEILAATAGTDGSQAEILTLEAGGSRKPFNLEAAQAGLHHAIVMKGREVFKHAVHRMTAAADTVLQQAGKTLEDVALIVPHQANQRILNAVANKLKLPTERIYTNVHEYGNTGSASVPLALTEAREKGRVKEGDLVLLTSFGAGFHWAAVLVQF